MQHNHGSGNKRNASEIAAMVSRLLSHYWTSNDPPETRSAQIRDWIDDLIEFPLRTVADAIKEWRRVHDRRPTIANIRALCQEAKPTTLLIGGDKTELQLGMTRDKYAQSVGFSSWLERADAIRANQERFRLAEEWRNSPEALFDPAIAGKRRQKLPSMPLAHTQEEMRAARVALGLEQPEKPDQPAPRNETVDVNREGSGEAIQEAQDDLSKRAGDQVEARDPGRF